MEEESVLARRLRLARESRGISQKQLGILAGLDEFGASARINQYERGKHRPDFATVQSLARVLKVPPSYFYEPNDLLAALIKAAGTLSSHTLSELVTSIEQPRQKT